MIVSRLEQYLNDLYQYLSLNLENNSCKVSILLNELLDKTPKSVHKFMFNVLFHYLERYIDQYKLMFLGDYPFKESQHEKAYSPMHSTRVSLYFY